MKWLGRIGMLLSFLFFWLAAPGVLGERKLRRLYEVGLKSIPNIVCFIIANFFYILFAIVMIALLEPSKIEVKPPFREFIVIGLYLIAMLIGWIISQKIHDRLIMPFIEKLANSQKMRSQFLIMGGLLFTLGFIMQFLSTF
jgi:hypothetical protein